MPMPSPRASEKQSQFNNRCMVDPIMKGDFPDNKQRVAVAYSMWKRRNKKKKNTSESYLDIYLDRI